MTDKTIVSRSVERVGEDHLVYTVTTDADGKALKREQIGCYRGMTEGQVEAWEDAR